ncbi:MAG: helix-turn-helix domain-containing protein [Patescibacteria group bacterium]
MKHKNTPSFLGLTGEETSIIQALNGEKSLTPTIISRQTGVKRTTVNFLLNKLAERGIIKKIKTGGHFEWLLADENHLAEKINSLYGFFNLTLSSALINLPDIGVEVFKSQAAIINSYKQSLRINKDSRVYAIQGNKSVEAQKNFSYAYLNDIQNQFKQKKIIIEGIVGEKSLEYFDNLPLYLLKTYENRLTVVYLIKNELIDFDLDILILNKDVILINYEKKLVVKIKNDSIRLAIKALYDTMKFSARKIDLNEYLKNLIKQKI